MFPTVYKTLLNIIVDLNNTMVWMVLPISNSSRLISKLFGTVPRSLRWLSPSPVCSTAFLLWYIFLVSFPLSFTLCFLIEVWETAIFLKFLRLFKEFYLNLTELWSEWSLLFRSSSSHFSTPLGNVPKAPTTIGINVLFLFWSLFSSLARFN